MVAQNGLGKDILWALLACQNRLVSRSTLVEAVQDWSASATPFGQHLRGRIKLDPNQLARADELTNDYLQASDSGPLRIAQTLALKEILDGLLGQVADPRARSIIKKRCLVGWGSGPSLMAG